MGVISPKINTRRVIIPVLMLTAALPNKRMVMVVAREDAVIFTMLFPIRIVLKSLPESSITFRSVRARLSPWSAKDWIRILFTVVIEVSAEEKNADRQSKRIRIRNCMASLESNIFNSF